MRTHDRSLQIVLLSAGGLTAVLLAGLLATLAWSAWPALLHFGAKFFFETGWDPVAEHYGAFSFVAGTIATSMIALTVATPLSVGVALFLTEVAPPKVGRMLGFLVEMLAAVPSVVYGLWGVFVLAPWVRGSLGPGIQGALGWIPFFSGPNFGVGLATASLVLAIMIIPTITAVCREVFSSIPMIYREGALAVGATPWETIRVAVLANAKPGIFGATLLGLGRALGETMAVTMVIGNRPEVPTRFFAPAHSMASVIANEYAEAASDLHLSSLAAVGLALFVVSLAMSLGARLIVRQTRTRLGSLARGARGETRGAKA